jgi:adenosylcobinamide kinase/adenosylcobinamide-phosphate guanylyltransferase
VIVTNEVGAGIIPANPLARRYADALGILNQRVAAAADTVVLLTAGLPSVLKPARKLHEVML